MAFSAARGFGAGIGMGNMCGVVTGSIMVLGFKYHTPDDQRTARKQTYELVKTFIQRFTSLHGSTVCRELLQGADLGTDEGYKIAFEKNLFTTLCPGYIKSATEILHQLL